VAEGDPAEQQASLKALISGAEKMFDNAERLFEEADLLAKAGGIARPLLLHQISLEECSKINTLGAWAVSLLIGLDVNQKKVLAAFGRHEAKNKHNAYMLEQGDAEKEAIGRGDWKAALEAFKQTQDEFHRASNQAKNGALYVDWADGEFVSPCERITEAMLVDIRDRNATFLGYASNEIEMFRRLDQKPDVMRELLVGFVDQAEKLREEKPHNLVALTDELLLRFLEDGKRKLMAKADSCPQTQTSEG
jgi:AbiV family abortive infection protein